jgi:hypothetical protein
MSLLINDDRAAPTSAAGEKKPALREQISHTAPKNSAAAGAVKHTQNQIAAASQMRFTRELNSYTRAVCMRLGYA